jgi:predicted HTH domain antitoxin
MAVKLAFPEELIKALGPNPEREALEAVLLYLISQGRMSTGKAGRLLGLDRLEAIRWYTDHGFHYPNLQPEDLAHDLAFAERD